MRITKSQLQEIIREELSALSEDENLDEFLGGLRRKVFGKNKKEKARDARKAQTKSDQEELDAYDATDAIEPPAPRDPDAEKKERKAAEAHARRVRAAKERRFQDSVKTSRRDTGPMPGRRKAGDGRYAMNRKDESQLRERIKEEVTKALKAHLKK